MYELEKDAAALAGRKPLAPGGAYEFARDVEAASFLFWGEHCVECAAPSCFQTCDLYRERPNGGCRRFSWGIVRNRSFPSARGYGVEVSFKKWGKLETRGNTAMMSRRRLFALERLIGWAAPGLDRLGAAIWRVTGDAEWRAMTTRALEKLGRKFHPRARAGRPPDAFLLEIFNPGTTAEALHVNMTVAREGLGQRARDPLALLPSFRKRLELPPGYSRHELQRPEFAPVTKSGLAFDIALMPEAEREPTLVFLTADFVRFDSRRALDPAPQREAVAAKCVVWDLDNTLWQGILLEDENVYPNAEVVDTLRTLDRRGILSSVASKNDFTLAVERMTEIGVEEYMLFPQIGWSPKSEGIKKIAEKLNIGLDTFIFVDDNQFELDEVAQALPMVTCINAQDVAKLVDHPRLQGSSTDEARRRRSMYREAMVREHEEREYGEDFFGFLRSCQMKLRLVRYAPPYFDRVCELVQRTNQLNFSGRKYRRDEIAPMLQDERLDKWVLECSDKFGSYGVVGFGLAARIDAEVRVEDFMLSCRVQGRFVEQAFFNELVAGDAACRRISVNFRATGRNIPAQQVLAAIGFEPLQDGGGMALDLRKKDLACDFIAVEYEPGELRGVPRSELV